jgi:hypothetical protein
MSGEKVASKRQSEVTRFYDEFAVECEKMDEKINHLSDMLSNYSHPHEVGKPSPSKKEPGMDGLTIYGTTAKGQIERLDGINGNLAALIDHLAI